jgi:hypothetical protein
VELEEGGGLRLESSSSSSSGSISSSSSSSKSSSSSSSSADLSVAWPRFQCGWETGTGVQNLSPTPPENAFDNYSGATTLTVSTAQQFEGSKSLRLSGSSIHYLIEGGGANDLDIDPCGLRFAVFIDSCDSVSKRVLALFDSSVGSIIRFFIDDTQLYFQYNGTTGWIDVGNKFTYTEDIWYQIELFYSDNNFVRWRVWDQYGTNLVHGQQEVSSNMRSGTEVDLINVGRIDALTAETALIYIDSIKLTEGNVWPGVVENPQVFEFTDSDGIEFTDSDGIDWQDV